MSTTETDFWTRLDAEQTPGEEPQQEPTGSDQPPADAAVSSEAAPAETAAEPAAPRVARPADEGSSKSKSQRIREYLDRHPDVRNREIVDVLGSYGVTAADVSNVRTQLRKKAEKQQAAKARVQPAAAPRAAREAASAAPRREASPASPAADEIAISEIEAGLTFIERAGSIERAREVVELIARIRGIRMHR